MMESLKFCIAFLYYKLVLLLQRLTGRQDRLYPGLTKRCFSLCPTYLKRIGKPRTIIFVTGTNGKTSTCGVITAMLRQQGYTVLNNTEWSMKLGMAHWFSKDVSLFNHSHTDYAVLELDELKSLELMADITPDYVLVTNLFRDSLKRNAYPAYIFKTLNEALLLAPKAKLILNADDPISGFLREGNPHNLSIAIQGTENKPPVYNAFDMAVCPQCLSPITYTYRHYMHIGKVVCPTCGLSSPTPDFLGLSFDPTKSFLETVTPNGTFSFPLLSKSIFNAYNMLLTAALFYSMGYSEEKIISLLSQVFLPKSREDYLKVGSYEIFNQMAKGQNVSATTAVFEHLSTLTEPMELILLLDEKEGKFDAIETITWLYDTDFEFLNTPYIQKIIIGSKIYEDYIPRLLLAGIFPDRFVCCPEEDVLSHVDLSIPTIYMLYDSDAQEKVMEYRSLLEKQILSCSTDVSSTESSPTGLQGGNQ